MQTFSRVDEEQAHGHGHGHDRLPTCNLTFNTNTNTNTYTYTHRQTQLSRWPTYHRHSRPVQSLILPFIQLLGKCTLYAEIVTAPYSLCVHHQLNFRVPDARG